MKTEVYVCTFIDDDRDIPFQSCVMAIFDLEEKAQTWVKYNQGNSLGTPVYAL